MWHHSEGLGKPPKDSWWAIWGLKEKWNFEVPEEILPLSQKRRKKWNLCFRRSCMHDQSRLNRLWCKSGGGYHVCVFTCVNAHTHIYVDTDTCIWGVCKYWVQVRTTTKGWQFWIFFFFLGGGGEMGWRRTQRERAYITQGLTHRGNVSTGLTWSEHGEATLGG